MGCFGLYIGAKTELKDYFSTSRAILAPYFWGCFDHHRHFVFFKIWAIFVPKGAKAEHMGCFRNSVAISAPMFSAVFASRKVKLKPLQISLRKLVTF